MTGLAAEFKARRVIGLSLIAGAILTIIGIRFWLFPYQATMTFGLDPDNPGIGYEQMISLRDIWLGLLAIAFAALKEWRALAHWFAFGALLSIAASSSAVTSHLACSVSLLP